MPLELFLIVYHANIVIRFYVLWVYVNGFEELFDGMVELANCLNNPYNVVNIELGRFGIIFKNFSSTSRLLIKNSAVEIMVTIFNNIRSRSFRG